MAHYKMHQAPRADNDPWFELGDSELITGAQDVPCPGYAPLHNFTQSRVFPVQRSPQIEGDADILVQFDAGDCNHSQTSSRLELSNMIAADRISPIKLLEPRYEGAGGSFWWYIDPTTIRNNVYECPDNVTPAWSGGPEGGYVYGCDHEPTWPIHGRNIMPILRVTGYIGYWIKFHLSSNSFPEEVYYNGAGYAGQPLLRFGMKDATSWAHLIDELDPTGLYTYGAGDDWCDSRAWIGSTDLYVPIWWCDQVIDMWLKHPTDDSDFLNEPAHPGYPMHGSMCRVNMSNFQIGWWPL